MLGVNAVLALCAGLAVYLGALIALRALSPDEWEMLAPLLPARLRKLAPG